MEQPQSTKRTFSLAVSLPIILVLLVAAPLAAAGGLSYFVTRQSFGEMLRDRNELLIDTVIQRAQALIDPALEELRRLGEGPTTGALDINNSSGLQDALRGAMLATPQISSVSVTGGQNEEHILRRTPEGNFVPEIRATPSAQQTDDTPGIYIASVAARDADFPALLSISSGIKIDEVASTRITIQLSIEVLAAYLEALPNYGHQTSGFILLGNDVVAQPLFFRDGDIGPTQRNGDIDLLVRTFLQGERFPLSSAAFRRASGHWSFVGSETYAFVYRDVYTGLGPPLTAVIYYPGTETRTERWIAPAMGILFIAALIGAGWVALHLARMLDGPTLALADAARRIERFDFSSDTAFVPSRFREFNETGSAFFKMASTLRMFQAYMPKALVLKLYQRGVMPAAELRTVTVMFADLQGYTAYAASRSAKDVLDYLNSLLSVIGPAIESHQGTIDKYIGDAVLAFWGAPDDNCHHAASACDAALDIMEAVRAFNEAKLAAGQDVCALRIGIHSGEVIVGNVGFEGRINYTIVGDVANHAQRLESGARQALGDRQAVTLVSYATVEAAEDRFEFTDLEIVGLQAKVLKARARHSIGSGIST
ncbi:adenylate/guanylate cyclase domain-containing protein [Phyllobacterium sp. K27]